jgi:hypothetical protein
VQCGYRRLRLRSRLEQAVVADLAAGTSTIRSSPICSLESAVAVSYHDEMRTSGNIEHDIHGRN